MGPAPPSAGTPICPFLVVLGSNRPAPVWTFLSFLSAPGCRAPAAGAAVGCVGRVEPPNALFAQCTAAMSPLLRSFGGGGGGGGCRGCVALGVWSLQMYVSRRTYRRRALYILVAAAVTCSGFQSVLLRPVPTLAASGRTDWASPHFRR